MRTEWKKRLRPVAGLPTGVMRVHEIFSTIQGESTFAGLPCTMVRTTGCNLRCSYCDTRAAFAGGRPMTIDDMIAEVGRLGHSLVEVTGGEPLAQPGTLDLLRALCDHGHTVLLETSGSLSVEAVDERVVKILDLKTPSSGEVDANRWQNLDHLGPRDQVKIVIGDRADYDWARRVLAEHDLSRQTVLVGVV